MRRVRLARRSVRDPRRSGPLPRVRRRRAAVRIAAVLLAVAAFGPGSFSLIGCRLGGGPFDASLLPPSPPGSELTSETDVIGGVAVWWAWPTGLAAPPAGGPPTDVVIDIGHVVTSPEATLTISIERTEPQPVRAQIKLFGFNDFASRGERAKLIDRKVVGGDDIHQADWSSLAWDWLVPDAGRLVRTGLDPQDDLYLLLVRVEWSRTVWVAYCFGLGISIPGDPDQALAAARGFFDALWNGDQAQATALLTSSLVDALGEAGGGKSAPGDGFSFLSVDSGGPWEALLWKAWPGLTLLGDPVFTLDHFDHMASWDLTDATVSVVFVVHDAASVRHRFTEEYGLRSSGGGEWVVNFFKRRGVPYLADGGTRAGWNVGVTTSSGALRCGPFSLFDSDAGGQKVVWSPDGSKLAFVGTNFDYLELWVIDLSEATGRCVLTVPLVDSSYARSWQQVFPVAWSDGGRLLFLVAGRQTAGPFKNQSGWWVGSVSSEGGPANTVAFVPREHSTLYDRPTATSDGSSLVIRDGSEVTRVGLAGGETAVFSRAGEDYSGDGQFKTTVSSDGWGVVRGVIGDADPLAGGGVGLLDARTGVWVSFQPPDDLTGLWFGLGLWVGDLVAMEFASPTDTEIDEQAMVWPAGLVALLMCDLAGVEHYRITPPRGDWRIGSYDVAPDGSAVAYQVGRLAPMDAEGYLVERFLVSELWVWDRSTNSSAKLVDLPEEVVSVGWPAASVVEWAGLGASRRGVAEVVRIDGSWRGLPKTWSGGDVDWILGEVSGVTYVTREKDDGGSRVFAVTQDGETVVYDGGYVGPYSIALGPGRVARFDGGDWWNLEQQGFLVVSPVGPR